MKTVFTYLEKLYARLAVLFASNFFFYGVLIIAALQGLWYALTFQLAMYDEPTHFGFIQMYAHGVSPFSSHQSPQWDSLGETTRSPNYLFYYVMSLFLRFESLFVHDVSVQIILLRLLCIALFIFGVYYYRRALLVAKIPPALINIVFLFFVLTPGVAVLPGVISYDNAIIFLTGVFFYLTATIMASKRINIVSIWALLVIALIGSLIKFTFPVIVAPVFIFIIVHLYKIYGRDIFKELKTIYGSTAIWLKVIMVIILLISSLLFVERVGLNFIKYHSDTPVCTKIMSYERCIKNPINKRNLTNEANAKATHFSPINIYDYSLAYWIPHMIYQQASPTKVLPVMGLFYMTFAFGGLVLFLFFAREILHNRLLLIFTIAASFYSLAVLLQNYSAYIDQGVPVATNGRYLFPILPIFCVLVGLSLIKLFKQYAKSVLITGLLICILAMTQGGGIMIYILDNFQPIYWHNDTELRINQRAKDFLSPLVKGG